MSYRFLVLAAAGAIVVAASPAFATSTIDFSTVAGDTTAAPLVIPTSDGNVATFTSSPGTFEASATGGLFTFGPSLSNPSSLTADTLTISFANPVQAGISFAFGIEDFDLDIFGTATPGDTLTVDAYNSSGTELASYVLNTTQVGEGFGALEEGNVYVDDPGVTTLTLTSGNGNPFAIGNMSVPEPFSISILGMGLAGLAAARRRRA